MRTKTPTAVRFKRRWRQYGPGDIATTLDRGVMGTMVDRHIAEYCVAPAADGVTNDATAVSKATVSPHNKAVKREQARRK